MCPVLPTSSCSQPFPTTGPLIWGLWFEGEMSPHIGLHVFIYFVPSWRCCCGAFRKQSLVGERGPLCVGLSFKASPLCPVCQKDRLLHSCRCAFLTEMDRVPSNCKTKQALPYLGFFFAGISGDSKERSNQYRGQVVPLPKFESTQKMTLFGSGSFANAIMMRPHRT